MFRQGHTRCGRTWSWVGLPLFSRSHLLSILLQEELNELKLAIENKDVVEVCTLLPPPCDAPPRGGGGGHPFVTIHEGQKGDLLPLPSCDISGPSPFARQVVLQGAPTPKIGENCSVFDDSAFVRTAAKKSMFQIFFNLSTRLCPQSIAAHKRTRGAAMRQALGSRGVFGPFWAAVGKVGDGTCSRGAQA